MNTIERPAAPESGTIPVICDRCRQSGLAGDADFSHLGDLLEFEPVPRKTKRADGWSPERQRAFIAALSATGSKRQAAQAIGMAAFGVDQMLKSEGSDGFKAAFDRAMAIADRNGSMKIAQGVADAAARNAEMTPPSRLRGLPSEPEPESPTDLQRRGEEAMESIGAKLIRCRRLLLQEISTCPGKRAAFEILTELPVDWDLAEQLEPQPFESWTRTNQHQPDMVLTADSGWGLLPGYGPDKRAELRAAIDEYRASEGLEPVDWSESESTERSEQARSAT